MLDDLSRRGAPDIATHYAHGAPFRSMMDLDEAGRRGVLGRGNIAGPARYADPHYVEVRNQVEVELYDGFVSAGGRPRRRHPHYALLGRSARKEASAPPGLRAFVLSLAKLPPAQVSFTWGDSFALAPAYRSLGDPDHPAFGEVFPLDRLPDVLSRWAPSTSRPPWMEIEIQLWFDPAPGVYRTIELGP